jgi:4-oxalocrotonate tautomerase
MPIIHITTWPLKDEDSARAMVEGLTRVMHEATGAPLHKISVVISEVAPARWGEAGIMGSDPGFREKSRRSSYRERE